MSLVQRAREARQNAYAPYSKQKVGAAVKATSGRIYTGVNVENADHADWTCAESAAIAAMIAYGDREIAEAAIVSSGTHPICPCAACRSRLAEFGTKETVVIMATPDGSIERTTLRQLVPRHYRALRD